MKKIMLIAIAFVLGIGCSLGQTQQDVLELKDGSVVKGVIVEQVPGQYYKVKVYDGNIVTIAIANVVKITKRDQEVFLSEYGGKYSLGFCIGGGGLIGMPARLMLTEKVAIEASLLLRPVIWLDEDLNADDSRDPSLNIAFVAGPVIYFTKRNNQHKQRVQMNGIFLKGGLTNGPDVSEKMFALGWAFERFKTHKKNSSVSFQLGLGAVVSEDKNFEPIQTSYFSQDESLASTTTPMIFWKVAWNFYKN